MRKLALMSMLVSLAAFTSLAQASIFNLGYKSVDGGILVDTGKGIDVFVSDSRKQDCSKLGKSVESDDATGRYYETGYGFSIFVKYGESLPVIVKACRESGFDFLRGFVCRVGGLSNASYFEASDLNQAQNLALASCRAEGVNETSCQANLVCFDTDGKLAN